MRSNEFLSTTFDRIQLEHWGWSQCVSLAETHRQICNMTYLGHRVTSRDIDQRSNFGIFRPTCIYFDVSTREEHDGVRIISPAFLVQKLFAKKSICVKTSILAFHDLSSLRPGSDSA